MIGPVLIEPALDYQSVASATVMLLNTSSATTCNLTSTSDSWLYIAALHQLYCHDHPKQMRHNNAAEIYKKNISPKNGIYEYPLYVLKALFVCDQ